MIRTLLLFLLVLFVLRAVWRLLGGIAQGAISSGQPQAGGGRGSPPAVKMTRDPICGTYVVPGKALELSRGGELIYFCSETCRDQYLSSPR